MDEVVIEREWLVAALDNMQPCKGQDPDNYDVENDRCIPFSKNECGRCEAYRMIEMAAEQFIISLEVVR